MACRSCRRGIELLSRRPASIRPAQTRNSSCSTLRPASRTLGAQSRNLHQTANRQDDQDHSTRLRLKDKVVDAFSSTFRKTAGAYQIYGATERIYKACSQQAAYRISEEDRKKGDVQRLEDGEEVGLGGGMWHDDFKLLPTFSTWSQVTMLHMYLIIARVRCMEKDTFQSWQAQLVDHFFHEAEERMDVTHNIGSRGIRQKYLQDLFLKWRGLLLAYDEGLVKGDAVLAAAVWRNLFRGREDVDARVLAAVVSWMRMTLKNLDQMMDEALVIHGPSAFKWPAKSELLLVDQPAKGLEGTRRLGEEPLDAAAAQPRTTKS